MCVCVGVSVRGAVSALDWLGGWVAGWLGGWVAGWLGGWVAGWLRGWVAGRVGL